MQGTAWCVSTTLLTRILLLEVCTQLGRREGAGVVRGCRVHVEDFQGHVLPREATSQRGYVCAILRGGPVVEVSGEDVRGDGSLDEDAERACTCSFRWVQRSLHVRSPVVGALMLPACRLPGLWGCIGQALSIQLSLHVPLAGRGEYCRLHSHATARQTPAGSCAAWTASSLCTHASCTAGLIASAESARYADGLVSCKFGRRKLASLYATRCTCRAAV